MNDDAYRTSITEITHQAWLAARRADLAPAVVRESVGIPDADLVLVPSAKALLASTFGVLADRARTGAHVYVGLFAGPGPGQLGAWWPHLEPIFGVRHQLRYGLSEIAPDSVELTVTTPFGGLPAGAVLTAHSAGTTESRAHLPLEVVEDGVEVLLTDGAGRPALVRRPVGSGAIPEVSVADERLVVDGLVRDDGVRFSWLVNLVDDEVVAQPVEATAGPLTDAVDGTAVDGPITLAPFGVRVLRHG